MSGLQQIQGSGEAGAKSRSSWLPVDLSVGLSHVDPPILLRRTDGPALIYKGLVHWVQGHPETGKTWLMLHAVKEVLEAGGKVVYLDFEDHPSSFCERLTAMGVALDVLLDQTRAACLQPAAPLMDRRGRPTLDVENLEAVAMGADLVVVDGQ